MSSAAVSVVLVLLNTALAVEQPPHVVNSSVMKYQAMMKQEKMVATTPTVSMETNEEDDNAVDMLTIMSECNETFRIEMDYLISLNESGSFPDETYKTPQCYLRCVLERAGAVSAEGVFDAARAADVLAGSLPALPPTDLEEVAAACAQREERCKCERCYNFVKCVLETVISKSEAS